MNSIMARKELFVTLIVLLAIAEASQLIRLRSGKECTMPGYFRDELDCTKFYYCPGAGISKSHIYGMSAEEMAVLNEIKTAGLTCPPGSIFDETVSSCENLAMIKSIPPECLEESKYPEPFQLSNSGDVPEIQHNH